MSSKGDNGVKNIVSEMRNPKLIVVRKKESVIKYASLIVLVIQNASQVLVMRYVRTRPQEMFLSTVAVFFTELVKLCTSFCLVCAEEKSVFKCFKVMYRDIIKQFMDTLKVCVPAILYLMQNNLLYVAVSNLPAATFMVVYQLKILTTALFTVIILRRHLSLLQWFAMVLLFIGVALVQLDEQKAKEVAKIVTASPNNNFTSSNSSSNSSATFKHLTDQSPIKGFIAVLVACVLSGFAGIYFEKILKSSPVSVWIRNIQLAVIALPVGLANVFFQDYAKVAERGFMVGFDIIVWGMIVLSSVGGLTVAVVMKYADNILKAFATSIAIIVACVVSVILFEFHLRLMFGGGTLLVILAIFVYSMFPYKKRYHQAPSEPPLSPEAHKENTAL